MPIFLTIRKTLALSVVLLAHLNSAAQSSEKFTLGKAFYEAQDFYNAIPTLEAALKVNPKSEEAWYYLGNAYYHSRSYSNAAVAFDKLLKLIGTNKDLKNRYYKAYLYYGNSLMSMERYSDARSIFLSFLRLRPQELDFRDLKRVANSQIRACADAIQFRASYYVKEYEVTPFSNDINTGYSEFSPTWLNPHTLVYASLNKDELLEVEPGANFPVNTQLYISKSQTDQWTDPEVFELSHDFLHTANPAFSKDGKRVVFSQCGENSRHEVQCNLYESERINGKWSDPEPIKSINQKGYTSTQPTFGEYVRRRNKSTVLYFVSDRPGGRGQMDLWYSVFKQNEWTEPVNCGSALNTAGNEVTPSYNYHSKELYFSSDLHFGLGGYDIFKTNGGLKSWKRPTNLGPGLNTGYDETYFSWREYLLNGTLVSNRPGSQSVFAETCCDDIYYFTYQQASVIETHVVSNDSLQTDLENVKIGLVSLANKSLTDSIQWVSATDENGIFSLQYHENEDAYIVVSKEGYETNYIKVSELTAQDSALVNLTKALIPVEEPEVLVTLTEDQPQSLSQEALSTDLNEGTTFILEHIYFDFNKAEIQDEAYQDLSLLLDFLTEYPEVKMEIGGHTDNKGSSELNHKLSQARAEAIKAYLVEEGIDATRLTAVGYGEDKPIAPNTLPDGSDNPEGRQRNRRTEAKIIK